MTAPLAGCTVIVTREQRGELGRMLDEAGATVQHVPLIEIGDVDAEQLTRLDAAIRSRPDWVIVTSAAGADRVAAVAAEPTIRLGAVGTATAARLEQIAGRPVDLVPARQIAEGLVDAFVEAVDRPQHVVIAQSDLAADRLASGLASAGHTVDVHTAYRTIRRSPSEQDRASVDGADAVVFASGSAARGWAEAFGDESTLRLPPISVAIGPSTSEAARSVGLELTHLSNDHSLDGLIRELVGAWRNRHPG